MRIVRIKNQKQSSKDSIPVYLYITTWCVRPWHFAPSTQKCSSFSQGKHFPGYFKTVMKRYMQHLRSQLFLLKPIPWNSVQTSVRNLTTTMALGLDHPPQTNVAFCSYRAPTQTVWPAVDNCGRQRYFWIFSSLLLNLKQSSKPQDWAVVSSSTAVSVLDFVSQQQAGIVFRRSFTNAAYLQPQGRSPSLWAHWSPPG